MATKSNARTQIIDFAAKQGWVLDTTATITWRGGWGSESKTVQNPHAFTRPAADGGRWQVTLDFKVKNDGYWSSGNRTDNRLRGAELRRFDAEGNEVRMIDDRHGNRVLPLVLKNTDVATWQSTSWLWEVTGEPGTPIRKRVEKLLTDPDLVAWLARESEWNYDQANRLAWARARQEQELRDRPLPQGWTALASAAKAVVKADGLSDPQGLIATLLAAAAAVEVQSDWTATVPS